MRPALLSLALFFVAHPARADFADCMAPGYLAAFPDAPTARDLTCVEHFRFTVPTPDGPREIRAISDAAADWAVPPAMVAEVERGARLAGAAFGGLGRFSLDNVTLLLLDDVHSGEELVNHGSGGEVLGVALALPDPARAPECLVTLYGLARGATDGAMAVTVAHEIFHCVQGATYKGPKYESYNDGAAWWIEGAAEAFAAAAVPESAAFTDRSASFDASVDAGVALNEMQHEAVHFFYWRMQTSGGLAALMPFQDAMADTGGAAAQQAAMRAALGDAEWTDFAIAYADSTIRHPQGGGLASMPTFGRVVTLMDTGSAPLPMAPFALTLGRVEYGCGVWGNRHRPSGPPLVWKDETEGASGSWGAMPEEIDTRDGAMRHWRLAAMPTAADTTDGAIGAERRRSCSPCLGSDAVDACLIGTWEMTGGGPAEWMRAQGIRGNFDQDGDRHLSLRGDGVFGTSGFRVTSTESGRDILWEGNGVVTGAMGGWSAEDGMLNLCTEFGGTMQGKVKGTTAEASREMPVGAPPGGSMSMRYSCTDGSLTTSLPMRGLPDMVTDYRRIAY